MEVRETDLEQRERKEQEVSEYRVARQIRLGHIPDPEAEVEEVAEAPKPKSKAKSKATADKT